jgi:hypothetical protein
LVLLVSRSLLLLGVWVLALVLPRSCPFPSKHLSRSVAIVRPPRHWQLRCGCSYCWCCLVPGRACWFWCCWCWYWCRGSCWCRDRHCRWCCC